MCSHSYTFLEGEASLNCSLLGNTYTMHAYSHYANGTCYIEKYLNPIIQTKIYLLGKIVKKISENQSFYHPLLSIRETAAYMYFCIGLTFQICWQWELREKELLEKKIFLFKFYHVKKNDQSRTFELGRIFSLKTCLLMDLKTH